MTATFSPGGVHDMVAVMGAVVWTPHIVGEHLVQAFRAMPGHVVYTVPGGVKMPGVAPAAEEAFSWAARFLAPYPKIRLYLYSWARCRATREPFSELCKAHGWPRSTADLGRQLAASIIADALNAGAG